MLWDSGVGFVLSSLGREGVIQYFLFYLDPLGSSDPFLDHVADHPDAHFDGQLLGYTLRSFEHHVVVSRLI